MRAAFALFLLAAPIQWAAAAQKRDALAGAVVRSREYIVRRAPHKVEEFIGDVRYRNRDRELSADWARYDHASGTWRARGHVEGLLKMQDASVVRGWGDESEHNIGTAKGWLTTQSPETPARFAYDQKDSHEQGVARRVEWSQRESRAWARGDVHVWGDQGEGWAETAEFRNPEKLLVLTQRRPVTVRHEAGWDGAIQAERIRAFQGQQRLEADERVQGWILFHNAGTDKKPKS